MAHAAPDLASCLGSGEKSRKEGDFGAPVEPEVQNQDPPNHARLIPQNFVWRLAGRPTSSTSSADDVVDGDMAVGVPVLRERFDPWRHDPLEEELDGQEERCKGCSKIPKARAAAAVQPPHDLPPGKLSSVSLTCASASRSGHSHDTPTTNPHLSGAIRPGLMVPEEKPDAARLCATLGQGCVLRGVLFAGPEPSF